ncbi:MAG: hypothetical protein IJ809_03940 [Clostridia bacterium]|nr:hypothetical protein [Clostridia bacterium]
MNKEYIDSLKELLVDEKSALNAYREMMANRYNSVEGNFSSEGSTDSSGNIQELGMEPPEEDDELSL